MKLVVIVLFCVLGTLAEEYEFPEDFVFGAATASYQVEGAWNEGGKGENIWDNATHTQPDRFVDGATGDIACNSYYKYKEDVQLLKNISAHFYRFSIAWSRILPTGKTDVINQEGIEYYNNLINELLDNGIQPYVTMFHWDLPQPLQDEGGWPERKIADCYVDYAKILFENFGDRVKVWFTFNEIMQICEAGYSGASMAPLLKNEGIGGYECTHTCLLAHGRTFRMYQEDFKESQNGTIGLAVDSFWQHPNTDSEEDKAASERILQMNYGWFMNPVVYGNYPEIMIERVKNMSISEGLNRSRLPEFTREEQEMLRGSFDFVGLNHYTSQRVYFANENDGDSPSHWRDVGVIGYYDPEWPSSKAGWLKVVPWGIRENLIWAKEHYGNIPIMITENGYADAYEDGLEDTDRVYYYRSYLSEILKAIHEDGCNVIGYTAWSLMDNFEWLSGYSLRFGIYYVDFEDSERPRTAKLSSVIYKNIIETRKIDWDYNPWNRTHVY